MRDIVLIVIHCSATRETEDIGVAEITQWHKAQGWGTCGYHYVIRRSGVVEIGRIEDQVGAHAKGHNFNSIGICLVGGVDANDKSKAEFNYTKMQMRSLDRLVTDLTGRFPRAEVLGHRDLPNVAKACPCFDVRAWWYEAQLRLVA